MLYVIWFVFVLLYFVRLLYNTQIIITATPYQMEVFKMESHSCKRKTRSNSGLYTITTVFTILSITLSHVEQFTVLDVMSQPSMVVWPWRRAARQIAANRKVIDATPIMPIQVTQKVSHYQESLLNRIKNRHCGYISHQFW